MQNGKNDQNCSFFVIFEVKKRPIYQCTFKKKKKLILADDLGQKSRKFVRTKGPIY